MKPLFDEQTRALFQVGFVRPVDFFIVFLLASSVVTTFFWWLFGALAFQPLVILLLVDLMIFCWWIVTLAYRTCYHVIMARSEINTMPESAAKLAVSYQLGVK